MTFKCTSQLQSQQFRLESQTPTSSPTFTTVMSETKIWVSVCEMVWVKYIGQVSVCGYCGSIIELPWDLQISCEASCIKKKEFSDSWWCVKVLTCLCNFKYTNKNVLLLQRWAVSMLKVVSTLVQSSFLEKSMMAAAVMTHSVKQSFCIALSMSQLLNPAPIMSSTQIQHWTGVSTLLVSGFAVSKLKWFW